MRNFLNGLWTAVRAVVVAVFGILVNWANALVHRYPGRVLMVVVALIAMATIWINPVAVDGWLAGHTDILQMGIVIAVIWALLRSIFRGGGGGGGNRNNRRR